VYAAILGPTLLAAAGRARSGRLAVYADQPTVRFVVDAGATVVAREPTVDDTDVPRLSGPTVQLIEGLSSRIPLRHDLTEGDRWLVEGVAKVFDPIS
jgi:hypothetical protein